MSLDFRSDVNAPDSCHGRAYALFYAICRECDRADVKLDALYQSTLAAFAFLLADLELQRAQIRHSPQLDGRAVVDLVERLVLALTMASDFKLGASALANLMLMGEDGETAMQKQAAALMDQYSKPQ